MSEYRCLLLGETGSGKHVVEISLNLNHLPSRVQILLQLIERSSKNFSFEIDFSQHCSKCYTINR